MVSAVCAAAACGTAMSAAVANTEETERTSGGNLFVDSLRELGLGCKRAAGKKGLAAGGKILAMKFQGTDTYVADDDLKLAVNAAITLERPLLIKGEPGTGKTMLAEEVARSLGKPLYQWHIKSTTKAQQGLYEYDAVSRLRDSQLGNERVGEIANYILKGVLWQAFEMAEQAGGLVDEIHKAGIDVPNDRLPH